ncbi:MAG: urease accessory protein UreD, partial [Lachnospirales bacterium]
MENKYGRVSKLNIKIKSNKGKTLLDDLYFTPPFKIMKPFYEEDIMKLILMSASPGIMEGDCQKITIEA